MSDRPNAAQLLQALEAIDNKIDHVNGVLRDLKRERDSIVEAIEQLMDEQGTTMLAAGGLVCEAKFEQVPRIQDWAALEQFILRHKRLDLFQRRLMTSVWRELVEDRGGEPPPGTAAFVKRSLSVRQRSK